MMSRKYLTSELDRSKMEHWNPGGAGEGSATVRSKARNKSN